MSHCNVSNIEIPINYVQLNASRLNCISPDINKIHYLHDFGFNNFFDRKTKIAIVKALDAFDMEYIELISPASSE